MNNVVIMLHGYKGTWNNGWFLPIQSKLTELNIPFVSPNLSKPENPDYYQWKNEILKIMKEKISSEENVKNIIIIAHSLACFAVLRMIDEILNSHQNIPSDVSILNRIKCLILVSPIVSYHQKFPVFTNYQFSCLKNKNDELSKIQISPISTYLIYSTDDNYVGKDVIYNFISHFSQPNQNENVDYMLNLLYIEKQGYKHFMQDDLPFITKLVIQVCIK